MIGVASHEEPQHRPHRQIEGPGEGEITADAGHQAGDRPAGEEEGVTFGGQGWIVDPSGVVIAETSADEPVVAADIYRSVAAHAKREYPCYVDDTPPLDPETLTDEL